MRTLMFRRNGAHFDVGAIGTDAFDVSLTPSEAAYTAAYQHNVIGIAFVWIGNRRMRRT